MKLNKNNIENKEGLKSLFINSSDVSYIEVKIGRKIIPYIFYPKFTYKVREKNTKLLEKSNWIKFLEFLKLTKATQQLDPNNIPETKTRSKENVYVFEKTVHSTLYYYIYRSEFDESENYGISPSESEIKELSFDYFKTFLKSEYEFFDQEKLIYKNTLIDIHFNSGKTKKVIISRNLIPELKKKFKNLVEIKLT